MYSASSVNRSAHGLQSPLAPDSAARRWYSTNAVSISSLDHVPTTTPHRPGGPRPQCGPRDAAGQRLPWATRIRPRPRHAGPGPLTYHAVTAVTWLAADARVEDEEDTEMTNAWKVHTLGDRDPV